MAGLGVAGRCWYLALTDSPPVARRTSNARASKGASRSSAETSLSDDDDAAFWAETFRGGGGELL